MLALCSVGTGTDIARKLRHFAQHEGGKIQTATATVGSPLVIESVNTGAVRIARNAQVLCITDVCTELELVIALHLGDVGDPLILRLVLDQRTVAARHAKSVAEV